MFLSTRGLSHAFDNPHRTPVRTPADENIDYEEIGIPTKNQRNLHGWWIPAKADDSELSSKKPVIILVHGWGRNVERMLPFIQALHDRYHLVTFDARNHGRSDDDDFSTMVKFAEDIIGTLDWALERPGVDKDRVGLIGLSIGGAAAIYAAGLEARIHNVMTVGAFARPDEVIRWELQKYRLPEFLIDKVALKYLQWRVGFSFAAVAPENVIGKSPARFFLIHGNQDAVIPVADAHRLAAGARKGQSSVWILPDYGHSDCHKHPEFWSRVNTFFSDFSNRNI